MAVLKRFLWRDLPETVELCQWFKSTRIWYALKTATKNNEKKRVRNKERKEEEYEVRQYKK